MARRIVQIPRSRNNRNTKECILVNYEGKENRTEEKYFNNYQDRKNPYYIKPIDSHVTDPLQMVEALVEYMRHQDIDTDDNYKVYCIFDTDVTPLKQPRIDKAIELAKSNNIIPIISSPCFEIWFREHFNYTRKHYNSNEELIEDLRKFIPNYKKNLDVYNEISKKTQFAINNCKQLEKEQIENGNKLNTVNCNPYTSVYKLVEYLIDKIKEK